MQEVDINILIVHIGVDFSNSVGTTIYKVSDIFDNIRIYLSFTCLAYFSIVPQNYCAYFVFIYIIKVIKHFHFSEGHVYAICLISRFSEWQSKLAIVYSTLKVASNKKEGG